MSIQKYHSSPTSNDLLESRIAENTSTLHGPVGAQSAEDVPNIDDVPAVSTET
ncbi:MAG: hypothetical protein ABSA42_07455 [Terracidiphilus sp.]